MSDVEREVAVGPGATDTPIRGRLGGIMIAVILPVALVAGWFIQFMALLNYGFGHAGGNSEEVVLLSGFLLGAVIGVGIPLTVLVVTVRIRRRNPRYSRIAFVASIIVVVVAVITNTLIVAPQIWRAAAEVYAKTLPPTAAEKHFADQDAGADHNRSWFGSAC